MSSGTTSSDVSVSDTPPATSSSTVSSTASATPSSISSTVTTVPLVSSQPTVNVPPEHRSVLSVSCSAPTSTPLAPDPLSGLPVTSASLTASLGTEPGSTAPGVGTVQMDAIHPLIRQLKLPPEAQQNPEKYRFEVELEFVQCLANPNYLNFLAQRGYFKEKEFINYLDYLQYWKKQEYAQFLKYPQCLHFLDLLQSEQFRHEIANTQCSKFVGEQQLLHWHHYTKKRMQFQEKLVSQSKVPTSQK